MKAREFREMTEDELIRKEAEFKEQHFKLKFQHALGQLENAMKLKSIKKDIARLRTILKEKQQGKKE